VPQADDYIRKLRKHAVAIDRIIAEARRVKAELKLQLREFRESGRPAQVVDRRRTARKVK
jgi:hypothetical protein